MYVVKYTLDGVDKKLEPGYETLVEALEAMSIITKYLDVSDVWIEFP